MGVANQVPIADHNETQSGGAAHSFGQRLDLGRWIGRIEGIAHFGHERHGLGDAKRAVAALLLDQTHQDRRHRGRNEPCDEQHDADLNQQHLGLQSPAHGPHSVRAPRSGQNGQNSLLWPFSALVATTMYGGGGGQYGGLMSPPVDGPMIELRGVFKRFLTPSGEAYTALRDLNMSVQPGEFCAVVGPTGCGKSTTLALISGLEPPSAGTVSVFGQPVDGIGKDIGYVFQTDAVFPWKSVLDNVSAGPRFRGESKRAAQDQARDWISRVGLTGFDNHFPHQLSVGMRKRAALAQTLINNPRIILMDEPFSALDVQTRTLMENELLALWGASGAAVVFVTHDLEEAIALADRVVVLTAGPATVKGTYSVDLPRPRNVAEIRFEPRFTEIYQVIWNDLREEVLVSYERAKRNAAA